MNTAAVQVEKLESLLTRVQRNRALPRAELAAAPASAFGEEEALFEDPPSLIPEPEPFASEPQRAPVGASPPAVPRPPARAITEPIVAPAAPPTATASRPARTPLEIAVEDTLERPSVHPHRSVPQPVPPPVSFATPAADDELVMLADPAPPVASRSIGQVVSKAPPIAAHSFGDLLRRSLSLRPR